MSFISTGTADEAVPAKGFDLPPYRVESFAGHSPEGWHCVCNKNGYNCLSFTSATGAKFTTLANATAISKRWNELATNPATNPATLTKEEE